MLRRSLGTKRAAVTMLLRLERNKLQSLLEVKYNVTMASQGLAFLLQMGRGASMLHCQGGSICDGTRRKWLDIMFDCAIMSTKEAESSETTLLLVLENI